MKSMRLIPGGAAPQLTSPVQKPSGTISPRDHLQSLLVVRGDLVSDFDDGLAQGGLVENPGVHVVLRWRLRALLRGDRLLVEGAQVLDHEAN